ncbi:unnamed protein product [Auanema sp. JU1783]|nr:unnamed protein product [Auanema sp. JU1783]
MKKHSRLIVYVASETVFYCFTIKWIRKEETAAQIKKLNETNAQTNSKYAKDKRRATSGDVDKRELDLSIYGNLGSGS